MDEIHQDLSGFMPILFISEALGIIAIVLMFIWIDVYRGGFAWEDDPSYEFNVHPLLMTFGLVFLYGNGILIYRIFRDGKKINAKIGHAVIMVLALLSAVVALKAVFDSHNLVDPPTNNLYTLHSWVGISTVALFAFQWIAGLVTFLFPGLTYGIKTSYLPVHVFFGILIFALSCASCLSGLTEKLLWANSDYSDYDNEGILANILGVCIVLFGSLVAFLATNANYRRLDKSEEQLLLGERSPSMHP